jgi:UDP-glucose 4-epimerase
MKVLITGSCGFIGSNLSRSLISKGYDVVGLTSSGRTTNVTDLLGNDKFRLVKGDVRDEGFIDRLLAKEKPTVVYHFAARLPDKGECPPLETFEVNALGTLNILESSSSHGVKHFLFGSSMSVYSEPPIYLPVDENHPTEPATAYGVTKRVGELYCGLYSERIKTTVLRFGGAYGPGMENGRAVGNFIRQALKGEPLTLHGNGKQSSDYSYVGDFVDASIAAIESGKGGTFNIGGGRKTSVLELAEEIIRLTGSKSSANQTKECTNRPFDFFMDIKKAKKYLHYRPHTLCEGLAIYVEYLRGNYCL